MRHMIKLLLISVGASVFVSMPTMAESLLERLPFNIKIGVTKNAEIEQRGVCEKKIKLTDNHFRCELYKMAGNNFYVQSSEQEVVSALIFNGDEGHVLPATWRKLGLNLQKDERSKFIDCVTCSGYGSTGEIKDILRPMNPQDINEESKNVGEINYYKLEFTLGNYRYALSTVKNGNKSPHVLWLMKITETY